MDGERICEYKLPKAIADSQDNANSEHYLNPHHDLFVLVEKSTFMKLNGEIEFRANLEKRISSEIIRSRMRDITKHDKSVQQVNVVNLVFNGNHHTLETVTHAMNFGTVSVVVKGSKGVAEKIAYEVERTTDIQKRQGVAENIAYEVKSTTDIHKRHDEDFMDRMKMKAFQAILHKKPYLLWVCDLQNMPDKFHERILDIYWKAKWSENHLASVRERDLFVVSNELRDCNPCNTDDVVCYFCFHDYIEPVRILVQHLGSMDSVKIGALQFKKMCNEADTDGLLKGLRRKDLATIMEVIQIMKARPVRGTIVDKAVHDHWKPHPDVSSNPTQKNRVLCFGEKKEKKGGQGSVESIESQNRFLPYWNYLYLWACMMRKHELAEILLRKVEVNKFTFLFLNNYF
ncbi:uncharacterized protein LOC127863946 isoform X2 [Dreissena polymorpha]|uniref:uncharacterized protein LOC127863946 isoform X2 n=1 Tax=Dreissena polymorpha TaxID=45954 RepID=UPI0022643C3E|nr:uncharacterized protein LOC127863946 isoform X2 [Dreissena polymorpha]